jgi:hypothetical protein
MRQLFLAVALTAVVGSTIAAGSQSFAQGPAYVGTVEAVSDGRHVPLERQTAQSQLQARAFGLAGAKTYWGVEGGRSPVRFHSGQTISFIGRISNSDVDPHSLFTLYTMQAHKDTRRIPVEGSGAMFSTHDQRGKYSISIDFQPYQRVFVKITTLSPLAPGEYAFKGTTDQVFMFGID